MTMVHTSRARRGLLRPPRLRAGSGQWVPIALATAGLFFATWVIAPDALARASLAAMLPAAGAMAIAGIGQTLVVQQRGIDLSSGSMITLAGTLTAVIGERLPLIVAVPLVLLVAAVVGAASGWLVVRLSVTPIIATLAMASILTGAVWLVSGGSTAPAPSGLVAVVNDRVVGIPMIACISVVLVAFVAAIMTFSTFGRRVTLSGAGVRAAQVLGIRTARFAIASFVISAVTAALAGVLLVAYLRNSSFSMGASYQLSVIAAVVVGGTSLLGGRGSVVATAFGALFLSQLMQTALTLGAPSSLQLLLQSFSIAAAATIGLIATRIVSRRTRAPRSDAQRADIQTSGSIPRVPPTTKATEEHR